jgi:tRNA (guanine37-N1)-methyltransferase
MHFSVLTIFPDLFEPFWKHGIIRRAIQQGQIQKRVINIRDFAKGRHCVTDDRPFGGGCGMVMKPEPLAAAIQSVVAATPSGPVILLTPEGRRFSQKVADELSRQAAVTLVCGRYEGIDERIGVNYIDDEISIGDVVLTGGEVPAMVIMDAVARLIPGTLGNRDSAQQDAFVDGLLDHAHYTRPREFEGQQVPEPLLSGNHARIDDWRLENALIRTFLKRPDLVARKALGRRELQVLIQWQQRLERIIDAQSLRSADPSSRGG